MTTTITSTPLAARQDRAGHLCGFVGGCVLGALLALSIAATLKSPATPGRFQVSVGAAHAVILDTATGQAWEKYLPADQGFTSPGFLEPKLNP